MNTLQQVLPSDQKTRYVIHTENSLEFIRAVTTCVGVTTSQPHTGQKPAELPTTQSVQ